MKLFCFSEQIRFNLKRIPNVLLIIVFTFSFAVANAKKLNYPFELMLGMSDAIVTGHIADISGDTTYLFNVSETIKGKTTHQIKVKMFRDWACDMRWKKAARGQQLFLCLTKTIDGYDIVGGSDGEIFIVDNKLRLFNIFNANISQYFNEANSPKLSDVIFSVRSFINCYLFSNTKDSPYTFRQLKTDKEISVIKNMNEFSGWLFNQLANQIGGYTIIDASGNKKLQPT